MNHVELPAGLLFCMALMFCACAAAAPAIRIKALMIKFVFIICFFRFMICRGKYAGLVVRRPGIGNVVLVHCCVKCEDVLNGTP